MNFSNRRGIKHLCWGLMAQPLLIPRVPASEYLKEQDSKLFPNPTQNCRQDYQISMTPQLSVKVYQAGALFHDQDRIPTVPPKSEVPGFLSSAVSSQLEYTLWSLILIIIPLSVNPKARFLKSTQHWKDIKHNNIHSPHHLPPPQRTPSCHIS